MKSSTPTNPTTSDNTLYVGMDTHKASTTFYASDLYGNNAFNHTVRGNWRQAVDYLKTLKQPLSICFEASLSYGPIHDVLTPLAKVTVAHPGKLRLIYQASKKSDRVDAQKLNKLLRLNEVPTVHVPNQDQRTRRRLVEFRRTTMDKRTRVKNQIRAVLRQYAISVPKPVGGLWTKAGIQWLKKMQWPTAMIGTMIQYHMSEIELLDTQLAALTQQLDALLQDDPRAALLMAIPGVGPRTAEAYLAYLDTPHRFAKGKQVGNYFDLVPKEDSSGDTRRLGRITKDGPGTVRKLLVEAAWQLVRRDPAMHERFERMHQGRQDRRKRAIVGIARHLSVAMWAMLKHGETWNPRRLPRQTPVAPGTPETENHESQAAA